jgi:RNA polymerase sigma factor for flagellar operon FliA
MNNLTTMERNKLVEEHLSLVDTIIKFHFRKIPVMVSTEREDLFQVGCLGLLDAAQRFDPKRDIQFKTYAQFRIRGQINDYLRKILPNSRDAITKKKRITQFVDDFRHTNGRPPTHSEIAESLQITVESFQSVFYEISVRSLSSFTLNNGDDIECSLEDIITDPNVTLSDEEISNKDTRRAIYNIFKYVTTRDRIILSLLYFEDWTMHEIGELLGITESRISQLHTSIIARLKKLVRKQKLSLDELLPYQSPRRYTGIPVCASVPSWQ